MSTPPPSARTEIRRLSQRAHYDRDIIQAILDEALLCHIAFNEGGSVHCLPTACWRQGDFLYIHGANSSRMAKALLNEECAVSITLLDGLVLARSAFHHSMNYRSVVIYGRFAEVTDTQEKAAAFNHFIEHVSPGRAALVREPSKAEAAGTRLLRLPLAEAAAKVRHGGPVDDEDDMARRVWAGVVPLALRADVLQPDHGAQAQAAPALPAATREPLLSRR